MDGLVPGLDGGEIFLADGDFGPQEVVFVLEVLVEGLDFVETVEESVEVEQDVEIDINVSPHYK